MHNFAPWSALLGGLLIGLAAISLWLLNGRIAGVSGILGNVLNKEESGRPWRAVFLFGLILGTGIFVAFTDLAAQQVRQGFPVALLIFAGLLTGFGTSLANGCTSGHGVCGLGRLSVRSLLATLTFLASGIATTYVVRHVMGAGA